jgi:outer membrane lipoprotein SlyB
VKEFIMLKKITIGAALAASTIAAVPAPALANHNGYDSRYERSYQGDRYYGRNSYRRCKGTTGTIVGGAGGALLGREIAGRGSRTTGTILGAAAGALLGRTIHKSSCRSRY